MNTGKQTIEAIRYIEDNDIKFIRMQFCDLLGQSKNIAVTDSQIERVFVNGIPFDADAVMGCKNSQHADLILHPDLGTLQLLPWRPQKGKVARYLCDVTWPDGSPFEQDSRYILKRQIAAAEALGYQFNVGAECEFFLFELDDKGYPTAVPIDEAGYFDLAPFDKGENVRRDIILTLEEMGFEMESSHHESGKGQHEIDFRYSSALESADNIMTFKTVVKTIAQRSGLYATFMPKPLNGEPGSGMHINMSLTAGGENVFISENREITDTARYFAAGILKHIRAITAVANPLVNSYKRLNDGREAPSYVNWGYESRQALIRIPAAAGDDCRMELRSPDPACNPYLTYALVLAAGLEGIQNQFELMPPFEKTEENTPLPGTLKEALDAMAEDALVEKVFGEKVKAEYMALKNKEWDDYSRQVHDWEMNHYFSYI